MRFKTWLAVSLLISVMTNAYSQTECLASLKTESALVELPIATPTSVGIDATKLHLVDKQINADIARGFPGAELIILKDGKLIKDSLYGYKRKYAATGKLLARPQPLTCATLFDLASNTKMYATNFALMHLIYQHKINLDEPIVTYLPEYRGCFPTTGCRETRTIRDLLTHQAGYMADPQFFNPRAIGQIESNLYSQERKRTESILITQLPFAKPRGLKPQYSDVDFMLLGIIIERITQQDLASYTQQALYQPLGLHEVLFNPLQHGFTAEACAATEIKGNTRAGRVSFPNIRTQPLACEVHDEKAYYSMGGIAGHAGLFASGRDLAVLVQLALNNGKYANLRLWDTQIAHEFTTPTLTDDSFGLGWRLAGSHNRYPPFGHYASSQAYGHTGWTGTLTLIDPKYNLAIILLTNKKHTPIKHNQFSGDDYATGRYAPIVDLIYQSLRAVESSKVGHKQ